MSVRTKLYTVEPGKFAARPLVSQLPNIGRNPKDAWQVQLWDGWDYELPENQSQWLKVCGITFNPFNRNKNSIMLAARRYDGRIEIAPYYNIDGARLGADGPDTPEMMQRDWPVLVVSEEQMIHFSLNCEGARVTTTIAIDGMRKIHRITHPGVGCFQYEVNFYAGGSVPASQEISVLKGKLTRLHFDDDGGLLI